LTAAATEASACQARKKRGRGVEGGVEHMRQLSEKNVRDCSRIRSRHNKYITMREWSTCWLAWHVLYPPVGKILMVGCTSRCKIVPSTFLTNFSAGKPPCILT
jgi:hypothetical protein